MGTKISLKTNRMSTRSLSCYVLSLLLACCWLLGDNLGDFADDPGVGWHLATGHYIAESGTIPHSDPFLHSQKVRPWISDQWGSDLLLWKVYSVGGWPFLYAALSVLFIFTYYMVGQLLCSGRGNSVMACSLALLLSFGMGLVHFTLRPVLIGNFLFALTFWLVARFHALFNRGKEPRAAEMLLNRCFLYLPVIFIVWANLHPSFVVGLLLLIVLSASLVFDKFVLGYEFQSILSAKAALLTLLCGVATLGNPYGLDLHDSIVALGQSDFFMNLNSEWKALSFKHIEGLLFESTIFLILLAGYLKTKKFASWNSFDLALLLVFGHYALSSARMLPYFSIVALPVLADSLQVLIERGGKLFGQALEQTKNFKDKLSFAFLAPLGLVSFIILAVPICCKKIPLYEGEFGPSSKKFPFLALQKLPIGEHAVVYGTPNWGGFITFFGGGKIKAVLDDRNVLLGEEMYREYLKVQEGTLDWSQVARAHGAMYVLFPRGKGVERTIPESSPAIIYKDSVALLLKL